MADVTNGVDRDALSGTVAAVRAKPELGAFAFRLENRWVGGGENRSAIDDCHGTCAELRHAAPFDGLDDEPAVRLSGDKGPSPVELVPHALADSLTSLLVHDAVARGMRVDAVRGPGSRVVSTCAASSASPLVRAAVLRRSSAVRNHTRRRSDFPERQP